MKNDNKVDVTSFIRQSPVVLLGKLLMLELVISMVYFAFRLPKFLFGTSLDMALWSDLNTLGISMFMILSVVQMIGVVLVSLSWANEYYVIKRDGVLHRRGVLALKEEVFSLMNVEALSVEQSVVGRLLNFGDVRFFSPVLKQEYSLANVSDPVAIKELISTVISESKGNSGREKIILRR